ncbi:MAG: hypothetical protein ACRDT6_04980 [Micromonosporaceae bacterium]
MSGKRYLMVMTTIRQDDDCRDEVSKPEMVICRLIFDDRETADRTADRFRGETSVRISAERVKILTIDG